MDYHKELEDLIVTVLREGASDLHLAEGKQPVIRVSGTLIPVEDKAEFSQEQAYGFIDELLNEKDKQKLAEEREVDFAYAFKDRARFRGNAYFQRGHIDIALRLIPNEIKSFEELNLPSILETFSRKQQGLFLVVGPTGQGKSTTLASVIETINKNRREHIMTIEDPIEYVFEEKDSLIDQRQVGVDTSSFYSGLKSMFRQDINVLMVGEMRAPETISTAVTAAETGHLVMSTLHTNNAPQTVERIIDTFPASQQSQIRLQLAGSLIGVFSQRLIPRVEGGLVPAYELLIGNRAVANLIRENRTHELATIIETSSDEGMIDLNRSLAQLLQAGEITVEDAYAHSYNPKALEKLL